MTAPGTMDPRLEEHLRSLAASHKGYKSRLTFCINVTERTIETARSYQPSEHMLEELKDTRSKLFQHVLTGLVGASCLDGAFRDVDAKG